MFPSSRGCNSSSRRMESSIDKCNWNVTVHHKLITGDLQVSQLIYLIKPYFSCTQTSVGTPHLKTLVRCMYLLVCLLTGLLAFFGLLYFSLVYVYPVFQHLCILTCILTIFPFTIFNPLNTELNPTCHLLASLGAHHILHVSGLRVKKP